MDKFTELISQLEPDITAEQYLQDQGLSTCDHYDGINDSNWREKLRSAAVDYRKQH